MPTAKKKAVTAAVVPSTEYLVEMESGKKFKVDVPATWKVTFGPWSPPRPGARGFVNEGQTKGTLRLYEGTSIKACWSGVVSFHDTSLDINHLVRMEKGDMKWEEDSKGNRAAQTKLLVSETFEPEKKEPF